MFEEPNLPTAMAQFRVGITGCWLVIIVRMADWRGGWVTVKRGWLDVQLSVFRSKFDLDEYGESFNLRVRRIGRLQPRSIYGSQGSIGSSAINNDWIRREILPGYFRVLEQSSLYVF